MVPSRFGCLVIAKLSDNVNVFTMSHRLKATSGAGRDAVSRCGCVRRILFSGDRSSRTEGSLDRSV